MLHRIENGSSGNEATNKFVQVYANDDTSVKTVGLGSSEPLILIWKKKNVAAVHRLYTPYKKTLWPQRSSPFRLKLLAPEQRLDRL